jgi:threonine dehydrogenase-like Zn-dependent dehydrogenase
MIELIASGAVDVEPLLTHIFPLTDVVEAFAAFRERRCLRPVLIPSEVGSA